MNEIYIKARAKINLYLEVLEKRDDNYHNIKSIFQKVNLYDELLIQKTISNKFQLETNISEINNNNNIIYKAYQKLIEKFPIITGVKVQLNKRIPMQAGLGGGSTDGASFILAMNKLFNLKMSKSELENICKNLGADVVPCLYDNAVLGEGMGELITPIKTNFKYYIIIIKPNFSCSTKEAYKKIDEKTEIKSKNDFTEIINGLENHNLNLISNNLYNIFEYVTSNTKLIKEIKTKLIKQGAKASLLTGSGSCIFGLFENKQNAQNTYNKLKGKYETYICTSYNNYTDKTNEN